MSDIAAGAGRSCSTGLLNTIAAVADGGAAGLAGGLLLALLSTVAAAAGALAADGLGRFLPRLPAAGAADLPVSPACRSPASSWAASAAWRSAFFLNTGAYYGEILRAGIDSVPAGQIEAARSTGLSRLQAMVYVVLPQAVRNVLPDLLSNTLEVVKLTSLASVVAVPELLFQARQAQSVTYNPTPIVVAAVIYFLLLWPWCGC